MSVKTRFAPSPTGLLHFGNVRTDIGDFIVRRSDGSFALFFVNAVDDGLMGATHLHGPEMPRLFRLSGYERAKRRLSDLNIEID